MSKKTIITILLAVTALTANAQFLFRISGGGLEKPSYMLGTIHSLHGSVLDSTPEYLEAEALCQQFYTEYDVTDKQRIMNELASNTPQGKAELMLPDGKTIFDILSKEQIEALDIRIKEVLGKNLSDSTMISLRNYQPIVYNRLISNKIRSEVKKEFGPKSNGRGALIDETCILRAKLRGMEVGLLDDHYWGNDANNQQLQQSTEEQVDSLMSLINNYDQWKQMAIKKVETIKQMIIFWCLADYDSFTAMDYCQMTVKNSPKMFKERNERWLPKIQTAMSKAPTLFVFGAGHLVGQYGVIQLLRDAGYEVEQIKSNQR